MIPSWVLCLLFCWSPTKTHTIQGMLSNYRQHDCITVQKNQSFFSVCVDFPMPSANQHPNKINFHALMSEGLFAGPFKLFHLFLFCLPSTVCFISIHRAYSHSQTYFRSKLTQSLEAPYPNMGFGISLCFFCSPVCIARTIS